MTEHVETEITKAEALLSSKESQSIHKLTYDSIMKCDADIRCDFYTNTLLSGDTTMFSAIDVRLANEMLALPPSSINVKIATQPERKYST